MKLLLGRMGITLLVLALSGSCRTLPMTATAKTEATETPLATVRATLTPEVGFSPTAPSPVALTEAATPPPVAQRLATCVFDDPGGRPPAPIDYKDPCSIVHWLSFALAAHDIDAWLALQNPFSGDGKLKGLWCGTYVWGTEPDCDYGANSEWTVSLDDLLLLYDLQNVTCDHVVLQDPTGWDLAVYFTGDVGTPLFDAGSPPPEKASVIVGFGTIAPGWQEETVAQYPEWAGIDLSQYMGSYLAYARLNSVGTTWASHEEWMYWHQLEVQRPQREPGLGEGYTSVTCYPYDLPELRDISFATPPSW